jgi:hypothetical protein
LNRHLAKDWEKPRSDASCLLLLASTQIAIRRLAR